MEPLDIRSFGTKKEKPDVTILVPHDGSIDDLSKRYPDIYREIVQAMEPPLRALEPKKDGKKKKAQIERYEAEELEKERHQKNREQTEEKLRKLLTIEQDVFATEAAHQIATVLLGATAGKVRVEVIKVLIPRLLVDMNRVEAKAFPNVISYEEHPHILRDLQIIYRSTRFALQRRLRGTNILIDLHTMSPTDPWEKVPLTPENTDAFMQTWQPNPAKPRLNDIITRRRDTLGNQHPLGDPALISALKQQFEDASIPHGFSRTFELTDEFLGPFWAQQALSYVNLDLTKDNGSKEQVTDKKFDLSELTFHEEKLRKITNPIGLAIADVVKHRSTERKVVV